MSKENLKEIKKGKSKPITLIFFIFAFLFLLFVIFLYTPWFKNSHFYKVYQAEKTLEAMPYSSTGRNAYSHYVDCLKNNQTTCQYSGGSASGSTPMLGQ